MPRGVRADQPALVEAVRIAIEAEPGEWGPGSLAEDLGVGVARIRRILRDLPHRRERVGPEPRLWPVDAAPLVGRLRVYLRTPRTLGEVAAHLGACPRTAYRHLHAAGAVARLHPWQRRYVWVLA